MSGCVDFSTFKPVFESLGGSIQSSTKFLLLGFSTCPYSQKALRSVAKIKCWHNNMSTVFIEFSQGYEVKSRLGYNGSFPIVFVYDNLNGEYVHIGGGDDTEEIVEKLLQCNVSCPESVSRKC